jgi:hypothetical protein
MGKVLLKLTNLHTDPFSGWALCLVLGAGLVPCVAHASDLVARWDFDEGAGDIAHDASGNGFHATLFGATWVELGSGHAIYLDGRDDSVDCTGHESFAIDGPVAVEAWIRPQRKAHGEASLIGASMSSFLLTYYNTEICLFYIGGGDNNVKGQLRLDHWNHVVAGFDGEFLSMWINGRPTGRHLSKHKTYKPSAGIHIGTTARPRLPHFKGMVDAVRLYDRVPTGDEALAHFQAGAAAHGFDPDVFSRVQITPYFYDDRAVVEADTTWLQTRSGRGQLRFTLTGEAEPDRVLAVQVIDPLPPKPGVVDATLSFDGLVEGTYRIRVQLRDDNGERPAEEVSFDYPLKAAPLQAPEKFSVGDLPLDPGVMPFDFSMSRKGGFNITLRGTTYPFRSRISWPNGDFNLLAAGSTQGCEAAWRVWTDRRDSGEYTAEAEGAFYEVRREIAVFPTHVSIKDKYTNTMDEDLGLLVYNETPVKPADITKSLLSGYEREGRQAELSYPDYAPSVFFKYRRNGMGILPIDDVFVVHAVPYVGWQNAAGIATEKFALPPGGEHTLEWAVYPTGSGDYYDFVNTFRRVEGRIGTVKGTPGFITSTPHSPWRREVPDANYIRTRDLKVGIIHSLSEVEDDPNLHVEGIELFRDFPLEMALIRKQVAEAHDRYPGLKVISHIAHSIYCTDRPEQFSDSRVMSVDGQHASWGDGSAFGPQRQAEGWRWWIFYPRPGNSFHRAMMESVDVMMDDVGLDGGFLDGFFAGYGGMWTYDRWDGHTALIDPATKTITRKMGSVLLLSQPSMIEYARAIRDKGGEVIALHTVLTRSVANETYIGFANESASGPELHLAPSVMALAFNRGFQSERHIYLDMLDKLRWGELFIHYSDGRDLTHRSLASRCYPMTFEEIRPGMVRGPERIVTSNPGVYGWPGTRRLHQVHAFDARGAPVPNRFVTTVDERGIRTALEFDEHESAVIEPIPVTIDSVGPVNTRVLEYGADGLRLRINGPGTTTLRMRSGAMPIEPGARFRVSTDPARAWIAEADGVLAIDVPVKGEVLVGAEIAR